MAAVGTASLSHLVLDAQGPMILSCSMLLADVCPDSRLCV